MDVALVQDAEHDVDRHQRRRDQQGLVCQRGLEGLGRPWKLPWMLAGSPSCCVALDGIDRLAQRLPGARLNDSVTAGNCPWRDGERRRGLPHASRRVKTVTDLPAARAAHVDELERLRFLRNRHDLQNDPILVQLREHRRDLPLAEGVVERVVDRLRGDAQPRRRTSIDGQPSGEPLVLLVAAHVPQLRPPAAPRPACGPPVQLRRVRIFERVLVLRAAHAVFDREVLHRLHEQRDALDLRQLGLQAPNDLAGAHLPLVEGLEVDLRIRPLLSVVLMPSTPMNDDRLSTAGSLRITRARPVAAWPWRRMEIDCGASEMPRITPVS